MSKETARRIFQETLAAIDVGAAVERALARNGSTIRAGQAAIDLRAYREIVAIAFGKASVAMAEALSRVLPPEHKLDGILVTGAQPSQALASWKIFLGGHPAPNQGSFDAGRTILERLGR